MDFIAARGHRRLVVLTGDAAGVYETSLVA
jgi:hypothetical protein